MHASPPPVSPRQQPNTQSDAASAEKVKGRPVSARFACVEVRPASGDSRHITCQREILSATKRAVLQHDEHIKRMRSKPKFVLNFRQPWPWKTAIGDATECAADPALSGRSRTSVSASSASTSWGRPRPFSARVAATSAAHNSSSHSLFSSNNHNDSSAADNDMRNGTAASSSSAEGEAREVSKERDAAEAQQRLRQREKCFSAKVPYKSIVAEEMERLKVAPPNRGAYIVPHPFEYQLRQPKEILEAYYAARESEAETLRLNHAGGNTRPPLPKSHEQFFGRHNVKEFEEQDAKLLEAMRQEVLAASARKLQAR